VPYDDVAVDPEPELVPEVVALAGAGVFAVVLAVPWDEAWAARIANPATMTADPPATSRLIRDIRRTAASRAVAAAGARTRSRSWREVMAPGCGRRLMPG
jgi:hypothetical protein